MEDTMRLSPDQTTHYVDIMQRRNLSWAAKGVFAYVYQQALLPLAPPISLYALLDITGPNDKESILRDALKDLIFHGLLLLTDDGYILGRNGRGWE
jgi:hypothetical protein